VFANQAMTLRKLTRMYSIWSRSDGGNCGKLRKIFKLNCDILHFNNGAGIV